MVSTQSLGFTGSIYLKNTVDFATNQDVTSGLIKAAVFGFIIALMGCYQRLQFQGRRAGRGRGHHQCGGVGLDPDPGRQLSPHLDPVLHMHDRQRSNCIGVKKRFGAKVVLDGIDLTIEQGKPRS